MKIAIIALTVMLTAGTPARAERACRADGVHADPIGSIGCAIEVKGRVKRTLSLSFPVEFIIESGGALFVVQYFKRGGPGEVFREGRSYTLKGTVMGPKQVLYDGSLLNLPVIMVMEKE